MTPDSIKELSIYLNDFINEADNKEKKNDKKSNKINISNTKDMFKNIINRLAYLKYLIDKEKDTKNKKELTDIYEFLTKLSFKDGYLKRIVDVLKDIKAIEINNKGKLPELPSEAILKALDTKMIRFKDYDKETFDSFVADIQKEFALEKGESNDNKSEADAILDAPNKDLKIDKAKEEEMIEDLKSIEKVNPGLCRALCVIDITSGLSVETSEVPDDDTDEETAEENKDKGESTDATSKVTDNLPDDIKELMGESVKRTSLTNHLFENLI